MHDAGGVRAREPLRNLRADGGHRRRVAAVCPTPPRSRSDDPSTHSIAMYEVARSTPTSWMVTMLGWFSADAERASRSNRSIRSASAATSPRKHLDGDDAPEPGVAGPVDLAHAAGADRRDDLVGSKACTGRQCHWGGARVAPRFWDVKAWLVVRG